MIKEIFDKQPVEYGSDKKYHISSNGTCWRKTFLTMKGLYKEHHSTDVLRIFDIGNLLHQQIAKELIAKASASDFQVVAIESNIPDQKYIAGKIDVILSNIKTKELIILDVKSAGKWTLDKVRAGEISETYANQVLLYMFFTGIKKGFLLFVGKEKGEIIEHEIIYDEEKAKKVVKEIEDFMINNVDKNIEPPKCNGGQFGCECCEIKGEWNSR